MIRGSSQGLARILIAVLGLCLATSCQKDDEHCISVSCDHGPTYAGLNIQVSDPVPLVSIYSGADYETGTLIWRGQPPSGVKEWTTHLALGNYAVTARYVVGKDTTLVVDGDVLSASATENCDGTCSYSTQDGNTDLRLKGVASAKTAGD